MCSKHVRPSCTLLLANSVRECVPLKSSSASKQFDLRSEVLRYVRNLLTMLTSIGGMKTSSNLSKSLSRAIAVADEESFLEIKTRNPSPTWGSLPGNESKPKQLDLFAPSVSKKNLEDDRDELSGIPIRDLPLPPIIKSSPFYFTKTAQLAQQKIASLINKNPEYSLLEAKFSELRGSSEIPSLRKVKTSEFEIGYKSKSEELQRARSSLGRMGDSDSPRAEDQNPKKRSSKVQKNVIDKRAPSIKVIERAMKEKLGQLRDIGKEVGIDFDLKPTKNASCHPWEKWTDEELVSWQEQALQAVKTALKDPSDELLNDLKNVQIPKSEQHTHRLSSVYDSTKFERCKREQMLAEVEKESAEWDKLIKQSAEEVHAPDPDQAILDHLTNRVKEVLESTSHIKQEEREMSQEVEMLQLGYEEVLVKSNEPIFVVDPTPTMNVNGKLFKKLHALEPEIAELRRTTDKTDADYKKIWNSLRDNQHKIEVSLAQGKIAHMKEIKERLAKEYKEKLESRRNEIQQQKVIQKLIFQRDQREKQFADAITKAFDPEIDSPRRNKIKNDLEMFKTVFNTMMQKLGESDINKIVQLFQRQTQSRETWELSVKDHEAKLQSTMAFKLEADAERNLMQIEQVQANSNLTRRQTELERNIDALETRDGTAAAKIAFQSMTFSQVKHMFIHYFKRVKDLNDRIHIKGLQVTIPEVAEIQKISQGDELMNSFADIFVASFVAMYKNIKSLDEHKVDELISHVRRNSQSSLSPRRTRSPSRLDSPNFNVEGFSPARSRQSSIAFTGDSPYGSPVLSPGQWKQANFGDESSMKISDPSIQVFGGRRAARKIDPEIVRLQTQMLPGRENNMRIPKEAHGGYVPGMHSKATSLSGALLDEDGLEEESESEGEAEEGSKSTKSREDIKRSSSKALRHGKSKEGVPEEGRAQDSKSGKKNKKITASRNGSPDIRNGSPGSTKSP